jgi:hypothetical protein
MRRGSAWIPGLVVLLLAAAGPASATPKAAVSQAIGGKTMPGYKAVKGKQVKLRPPSKDRTSTAALGPGGAITSHPLTGAAINHLDQNHYNDIREMGLALLRRYKPDEHFFIAVGRSPSSLAAFLTELNPNMVMTFPASDLRIGVQPAWKPQFFDHFEKLIPDDVLRGERTIVLFDRSHDRSGTSLSVMKTFLEEYLRQKNGKAVPVKAAGLANQGPLVAGVDHVSTAGHPHTFQYFGGNDHDEVFAAFKEKHQIGVEPMQNILENQSWYQLRNAVKQRMAHDDVLDHALKNEFGDRLGEP